MTQFWPEVDDFSNDATVPWSYPDRYLLIEPAVADETANSVTYESIVGCLYRRIDESDNLVSPAQAGFASVLGQTRSTSGKTALGCVVERSIVQADVDVSAEFELEVFPELVSSSSDTNFLRGYFVWARVAEGAEDDGSAQTFVSGTRFPGILYPRGLFFGHVKPATGPDQFVLGHLDQGVGGGITIDHKVDVQDVSGIGSVTSPFGSGPFVDEHLNQSYGFYKPETLRILCEGSRVRCYARVRGGDVGQLNEILIFDETTTETQAGRAGFSPQLVVRNAANQGYSLMHAKWLQIKDPAADTLFRDEWGRINFSACYLVPEDGSDTRIKNGPCLNSAYTGDGFGNRELSATDSFPHYYHLISDPANDNLSLGRDVDPIDDSPASADQNYGFYLSQQVNFNEPLSDIDQRRYAEFGIDTTNDWELGIALRMTVYNTNNIGHNFRAEDISGFSHDFQKQGYLAVISSEGGSFEIRLDRYNLIPTPGRATTIARASISDPGSPATFTFEFEARRGSIEGTGQAYTSLRVKYDGVIQTLVPESSEYERVNNWIRDATADHVPSGFYTGFFYQRDTDVAFEPDAVTVGTFSRLTPSEFDPEVPPQNQASVALLPEDDGKSGSLTTPISWEISEEPCSAHNAGQLATGFRYSSPQYSQNRRKWTVRIQGATYAEAQSLLDLIESNGWVTPFDWTRADTGETHAVKFLKNEIRTRYDDQTGTLSARFGLIELFGASAYN